MRKNLVITLVIIHIVVIVVEVILPGTITQLLSIAQLSMVVVLVSLVLAWPLLKTDVGDHD